MSMIRLSAPSARKLRPLRYGQRLIFTRMLAVLLILFSFSIPAVIGAQPMSPDTILRTLFETDEPDETQFSPAFLAQVPASSIAQLLSRLRQSYGALQEIEADGAGYQLHFEGADIPAQIVLDLEGRITGLVRCSRTVWIGRGACGSHHRVTGSRLAACSRRRRAVDLP